ncbi:MAG: peptidylprolyl isomerase [FCB group bacterium]|nr:peptidylprolyl isomerase [FCB group bacterium]MBL7027070.1 peptidylprolyl isomerase [Candidatus Neomarinimicrobiota bacterium]MBL7122384.1 peptidylprolyl isomerase [Candidatus Neomarinimicrobiota bacterium]
MVRKAPVLLLVFTFLFIACSKEESAPEAKRTVVATVDNIEISETSFQRTYLPVLLYGDKFDSEENRSDMINFLIGQKILAQKGRAANLDTSTHIVRMRTLVENRALSRQLYRTWVKDQLVLPTEEDLRRGFKRGQKGLFVRHLFAKTEEDIREYSRRLASGDESFYTLAQEVFADTMLSKNGGALGWMTFGDLDETLEDTVYSLSAGQISQPVKSQYGWHILSIDDSQEEVFVTEEDYQKNRDLIYNKILERRENLLGKQVLNDFMADFKIEFNREIARQVWPKVIAHLNPGGAQSGPALELSGLTNSLDNLRQETLLTVDGESWSVAEILKRLPNLDRSLLYSNLYVAASNIIRDEMIAREARDLGLQNHPDVLEEVQDSQDQIIADTYVGLIADTLEFTDDHHRNYYDTHKLSKYHAPDSLKIEIFGFSDSTVARRSLYKLRDANISTDPADKMFWITAGGETDPLFALSRSIAVGTLAGPVRYNEQWVLVKLLERKRFPLPFDAIKNKLEEDMERERFASTRSILLGEFRPKHKISIDYKLLNR